MFTTDVAAAVFSMMKLQRNPEVLSGAAAMYGTYPVSPTPIAWSSTWAGIENP